MNLGAGSIEGVARSTHSGASNVKLPKWQDMAAQKYHEWPGAHWEAGSILIGTWVYTITTSSGYSWHVREDRWAHGERPSTAAL